MLNDVGMDRVMSAISDPVRRAILDRLAAGPASAGDVAAPFAISLPAISRHLKVLEGAGLISRVRQGRTHVLALDARPIREVRSWASHYEKFWNDRLAENVDRLAVSGASGRERSPGI